MKGYSFDKNSIRQIFESLHSIPYEIVNDHFNIFIINLHYRLKTICCIFSLFYFAGFCIVRCSQNGYDKFNEFKSEVGY